MTRRNLLAYRDFQVFLNYPFDSEFDGLANALHFPVVAAGLLPVCAKDLTVPDRPRLEILVDAIRNCRYSAHEFSRSRGEGDENFARMNMPLEMGMALFHALESQRSQHRCAFFVPTQHEYKRFASDLSGLDPKCHQNDESLLVSLMYEWLRSVVPNTFFSSQPAVAVVEKYRAFQSELSTVKGSGEGGKPSHDEVREVMYQVCAQAKWWDWRQNRAGMEEFPSFPLAYR
jgi:hypothetical protein